VCVWGRDQHSALLLLSNAPTGNDCFQWGTQRVAFFALVLQMIITLPFNAIPIVGSIAYAAVNGAAPLFPSRSRVGLTTTW